jgi:hypothetical protein
VLETISSSLLLLCSFYVPLFVVWRCCHVQILSYLNNKSIGVNPSFAIIFNLLGFLQQGAGTR